MSSDTYKPMTWHDLLKSLANMPPEELDKTAVIATDTALVNIRKVYRSATMTPAAFSPFIIEPELDLKVSLPEVADFDFDDPGIKGAL